MDWRLHRRRAARSSSCRRQQQLLGADAPRTRAAAAARPAARPGLAAGAFAGREAPPPDRTAGRDREAHQRRERSAQEALHQPATREGRSTRSTTTSCAAGSRSAARATSPNTRAEALRRAGDERDRGRRGPRARHRGGAPVDLEDARPPRRGHRQGGGAFRPVQHGDAPQRPTSSSSPRASSSRATKASRPP